MENSARFAKVEQRHVFQLAMGADGVAKRALRRGNRYSAWFWETSVSAASLFDL